MGWLLPVAACIGFDHVTNSPQLHTWFLFFIISVGLLLCCFFLVGGKVCFILLNNMFSTWSSWSFFSHDNVPVTKTYWSGYCHIALSLGFVCLLLFYTIATVISVISWRWYDLWDEMEKARAHTLLLTQGIFNLHHHTTIEWEALAFDDAVSYNTQWGNGLQHR